MTRRPEQQSGVAILIARKDEGEVRCDGNQGNSFIQTAVQGCHDHGLLDMVALRESGRFQLHGQTADGLTVAPGLNN